MNETLLSEILDGFYDSELGALERAIRERKDSLNLRKIYSFKSGDMVEFNFSVRPKYLKGLKAKVVRANQKTLTVSIVEEDKATARRYGYCSFRTPLSLVDKVEA